MRHTSWEQTQTRLELSHFQSQKDKKRLADDQSPTFQGMFIPESLEIMSRLAVVPDSVPWTKGCHIPYPNKLLR